MKAIKKIFTSVSIIAGLILAVIGICYAVVDFNAFGRTFDNVDVVE